MRNTCVAVAALTVMMMQSASARAEQELPPPIAVVVSVLQLSEPQTEGLLQTIKNRDDALRPIVLAIQTNQQALGKLLESANPDPAAVGQLLIAIHDAEKQAGAVRERAAATFEQSLTTDQQQRLHMIRQAAQIAPALPAFTAVGLV